MHSQGNHKQDGKITLRINLQKIQIAHVAQYPKNKEPNQKLGGRRKETCLQIRCADGQLTHEKMLNITKY